MPDIKDPPLQLGIDMQSLVTLNYKRSQASPRSKPR
jgi:hypothetical protein